MASNTQFSTDHCRIILLYTPYCIYADGKKSWGHTYLEKYQASNYLAAVLQTSSLVVGTGIITTKHEINLSVESQL